MGILSEEKKQDFCRYLRRFAENGNDEAYNCLGGILDQVIDSLRNIVRQRLGGRSSDEDDIVSRAVCSAIHREALRRLWAEYGEQADLEIWLRMWLKAAISEYRRGEKGRPDFISLEDMGEQGIEVAVSPAPSALSHQQRIRFWEVIRQCLGEMDFQIVWLRQQEQLKWENIAFMLCITNVSARQRYHYALGKLSRCDALIELCLQARLLGGDPDEP